MRMGEMSRQRRICVAVAAGVAATAALGLRPARAATDLTFNISLVGSLNPLSSGPGTTNNWYADLWAEGDLVVLGSVSTSTSGGIGGVTLINNANPANPVKILHWIPPGGATVNGQFRDVIVRNNIGYFAIDSALSGGSTIGEIHIVDLTNPAQPVPKAVINAGAQYQGFVLNHDLFIDGNFLYVASNRTY